MRSLIPGAPGVPVGGVTGAGRVLRVVSWGSCACACTAEPHTDPTRTIATSRRERETRVTSCVEVVVVVPLTNERTVYFTL